MKQKNRKKKKRKKDTEKIRTKNFTLGGIVNITTNDFRQACSWNFGILSHPPTHI